MEDRRTLLAFLLIGLILLAMPYYYDLVGLNQPPEPQQEEPVAQEADDTGQRHVIEEPPATKEVVGTVSKPRIREPDSLAGGRVLGTAPEARSFTARLLYVRTPLMKLVFSTRGGALVSAELLSYETTDGNQVDLIPEGGRGLVLEIENRNRRRDLSAVEFIADSEGLVLGEQDSGSLRLRADLGDGQILTKSFHFDGARYGWDFDLDYQGLPPDTELRIGWENGIARTEKETSGGMLGMGSYTIVGTSASINGERIQLEEGEVTSDKGQVRWVGVVNEYFFLALAPHEPGHYLVDLYGQSVGQGKFVWDHYSMQLGDRLEGGGRWSHLVYTGPLDYEHLASYERGIENGIDLGYPIIRDISKFLLVIFIALHEYVPNYGWVLILFAVSLKVLLYPLTKKSYESMARMGELQPHMTAVREKYKSDTSRQQQELMKLYKEHKVNPLSGCLLMLPQMPIFFALYKLFYSIELRQEPFVLWIRDLSLPDEIELAGIPIRILPLVFAGSQMFMSKMTMRDPKQAAMVYLMPVFMLFIFWNMPSGLCLYWTVFNLLTLLQQHFINHNRKGQLVPPVPVRVSKKR